jgi:hypothetical protein
VETCRHGGGLVEEVGGVQQCQWRRLSNTDVVEVGRWRRPSGISGVEAGQWRREVGGGAQVVPAVAGRPSSRSAQWCVGERASRRRAASFNQLGFLL